MPAVQPGSTILVTGASGFIAAHVVEHLLNAGFNVRGTVRSDGKGQYLEKLFKDNKGGKFEYVLVEDITKPGIFDEAVKGVDAVAHTASPFYTADVATTEELIDPAVKGTRGVLESIHKHNPDVKRVVITSSVAAIMNLDVTPPVTFTEKDWNSYATNKVEKEGKDAGGGAIYQASKTYAEKAGWKFLEDNKPSFDIATINPPFVLGPVIHQVDKVESLNTSVATFHAWAAGKKTEDDLPGGMGNWVDVRDIAEAHVKALVVEEAGGERFIVGAGAFTGQDIVDILHKSFPDLKNVPVGKPGTGPEEAKKLNVFDGSKAERVLGIKYHALETTINDMAHSLQERFGLQ